MTTQTKRKITTDDLYNFKLIADPRLSPDGKRVAYIVTTIEKDKNDYRSSLYVSSVDGTSSRRLTTFDSKDSKPEWSPDGSTIAFLSNRSGKGQIWGIRADGGEAWQISDLPESVTAFEWSPDGSRFVAVSKAVEGQEEEKEDEEKSDVRHITKIRYKFNGQGFLDFKPTHLWLIPAEEGEPKQLTNADANDSDPKWSPNGREIAFVSNRSEGREWNTNSEIWIVPVEGGEERPLINGEHANFRSPSWSPDGTKLVVNGNFHAYAAGGFNSNLWVIPAAGGDPVNFTSEFDRSIGDSASSDMYSGSKVGPVWTPDQEWVLHPVSDSGSTHLYKFPVNGGGPVKLTSGDQRVSGFSLSSDGSTIAYVSGTTDNPGDLFITELNDDAPKQITTLNKAFLDHIALSQPEEFWVPSLSDGHLIQGWVMKPVDFDPSVKYPMILQIHGGPHGMYSYGFMHEFQLMAARGYVVVYTNPRGSSGYGEAFTRYTHSAWGEKDMPDVMAAVEHVVAQGYVDETRLGVTGGSYGGYLTLWIIGHTDRFKAAVTQRCVSNLYSFYGTSDIGWHFMGYNFDGTPWENRDHFMKYSPISYVDKMKTPLLIVHSEEDHRCPIEQAEQVFISLKKLGQEVEFVRIPGENHDLSRNGGPKHRTERLEHIIGWFDRYL